MSALSSTCLQALRTISWFSLPSLQVSQFTLAELAPTRVTHLRRLVFGDWWLVMGGWWQLAVVDGWWLAVGSGWWLAVGGGWWLPVGGPGGRSFEAVLSKKKFFGFLKDRPGAGGDALHPTVAPESGMLLLPPGTWYAGRNRDLPSLGGGEKVCGGGGWGVEKWLQPPNPPPPPFAVSVGVCNADGNGRSDVMGVAQMIEIANCHTFIAGKPPRTTEDEIRPNSLRYNALSQGCLHVF